MSYNIQFTYSANVEGMLNALDAVMGRTKALGAVTASALSSVAKSIETGQAGAVKEFSRSISSMANSIGKLSTSLGQLEPVKDVLFTAFASMGQLSSKSRSDLFLMTHALRGLVAIGKDTDGVAVSNLKALFAAFASMDASALNPVSASARTLVTSLRMVAVEVKNLQRLGILPKDIAKGKLESEVRKTLRAQTPKLVSAGIPHAYMASPVPGMLSQVPRAILAENFEAVRQYSVELSRLKVLTEANSKQAKILSNDMVMLASKFGMTTAEVTRAAYALGEAVPALMKRPEDLGKAAESILMMAQLSKESVEQVAGSMGGLMQIYAGIEGPQENLAKRMQMLSDTLAVAANVGTKSIAEYAQALKRFAFTAKAHGMTLDESMAAVVAMTDSGIDNAGKKFRNLLLLTDKWSVMYPKLAIDDKDGKGATANLIKSAEQIQKLASQGRRGRIQLGAIFGKENVEGAMAMANATKKYLDTQTALDAKKGKLSAMWGSFAQDPSIQLDMLLNNLKLFIQEGLKPVLKFLGEIALVINTIIQFFKVKDTDGFLTVLFKENAWKAVAVLASVVVGALLILVGTVGLITAAFAVLGTQQMLNNVLTSLGNQSLREQTRQMMANTAAAWANARAKAAVATSTVASTGTVATSSAVITGGAVMAGGAVPAVAKAGLFAGLITTLKGVLAAVFTALGGWIGILIVGLIAAITVGAIYMFKKNKKSAEGAASVSAGESYFTKSSDSFNQNNKVTIQGMIAIKDEGSNVKKATMSSSNGLIGMSMVV